MARPTEYDNLLKIGQLKEAESSQDSIDQFVQIAQNADASAMESLLAEMLPASLALMNRRAQT